MLKCSVKQPSKTKARPWLPSAVDINSSSDHMRNFAHKNLENNTATWNTFPCTYTVLLRTNAIFYPFNKNHFLFLLSWACCHYSDLNNCTIGLVLRWRVASESHVIPLSRCKLKQNTCALVTTSPGVGSLYHAFRKNTEDWTCGQPVLNLRCHVGI